MAGTLGQDVPLGGDTGYGDTGDNIGGSTGDNIGGSTGDNIGGSTGDNTGGSTGDNIGGSTGDNIGGSTGDNIGGSTGDNIGGSTGDNIGGSTGDNIGGSTGDNIGGSTGQSDLSPGQRDMLERCLAALTHAKNDSHTLAALLLITRVCPAAQMDSETVGRVLQAVGLSLPGRLLATALRGDPVSTVPPCELVSLGTALLASISTQQDACVQPQLLSTVPMLLGVLADWQTDQLDQHVAADCYQVLDAVCASPQGPDKLLARGAVPALCRAVSHSRILSRDRALPLLGHLLSGRTRTLAWDRHAPELTSLLDVLTAEFCQASCQVRLELSASLLQFLPPPGGAAVDLSAGGQRLWEALRPLVQSRLTPAQLGPVLVLSACLLDLVGWAPVGPARFCCLLVNRACVEVRMALEEPPGQDGSPCPVPGVLQNTVTACYRLMEAAVEQACAHRNGPDLNLQQSRQVLRVLEEAFAAIIYYLQQADASRTSDPFLFATFRSLCVWLAEETSCLRDEVTALLPFLIGYARAHLKGRGEEGRQGLPGWMEEMSQGGAWTGQEALRYLLPALCHLSAEEAPRQVLLKLDTPALLVHFLHQTWSSIRARGAKAGCGDASMETACSTLLNFTVTQPECVRTDECFQSVQTLLSEALPVLLHKPRLLVLAANFSTLGLMIGRLVWPRPPGELQVRFSRSALRFLSLALYDRFGDAEFWDEAGQLCALSLQALAKCVGAWPGLVGVAREEGWLQNTLDMLGSHMGLPHPQLQGPLEELLVMLAQMCPLCKREMKERVGVLGAMGTLQHVLEE